MAVGVPGVHVVVPSLSRVFLSPHIRLQFIIIGHQNGHHEDLTGLNG
jgi:hypothetical protein